VAVLDLLLLALNRKLAVSSATPPPPSLKPWVDSSAGIHTFAAFDSESYGKFLVICFSS
jgi:hypothetical protein